MEIHAAAVPAADHPADPVQGATSMAAINGALQTELRRARRFKQCCVTMRLGLDGWHDLVADRGRHAAGRLLSDLALVVKNEIRDVDWVARTPDHDLIIFLADTGRIGALQAAHRIRDKAMSHVAGKPDGPCGFALSLGLAGYPEDARFAAELLQRAGRALLRARALGWGVADRGLPEERRFLMVPPEAVRVVVRVLDTAESPPAGEEGTSGLLFTSPVPYAVGTSLELSCLESTGARRMQTRGRVVRLEQRPAGKGYHVGVMCDLPAGTDVLSRGDSADRVGD